MWLILFSWLFTAAVPAEAQSLRGDATAGTVVELTADSVVLETKDGQQELSTKDLLLLQLNAAEPVAPDAAATVQLELTDGSKPRVRSLRVMDGTASVTLAGGEVVSLPLKQVSSARLPPADPAAVVPAGEDADWRKISAMKRSADLLVVRSKGVLDYLEGEIGELTDKSVTLTVDGETIPVKWSRVAGLLYYRSDETLVPARCVATDIHGSVWHFSEWAVADDTLTGKTPAGLQVTLPLAAFDRFDFSRGKIQYLSDMTPESATWTPYLGASDTSPRLRQFFAPQLDRGFQGQPIMLDGRSFKKGLAIHSRTELVYRLPEKVASFEALAGLDDGVAARGDVELVIFGDDRELYRGTFQGPAAAQPISLNLQGVNRLKLIVDYGAGRDESDHLNLAEARLVK